MTDKAFFRALGAELYIIGIVLLISQVFERFLPEEDTIMIPIMMLSLLVLSVVVMGYLFFAKPIELYLEGKAADGVRFLIRTVAYFAVLTAAVVALALLWRYF